MQRPAFLCRRRFSGLTAIEVIAVLVVVAVLVALLLPALNRARSGSRKAACADNLRQLAAAAHLYAEAYSGVLPSSFHSARRRSLPAAGSSHGPNSDNRWQWHTRLLPYLEKKDLYNSINWSFGPYEPAHRTVSYRKVDTFLCPADQGGRLSYPVNAGTWYDYDYAVTGRGRHDGFQSHWSLERRAHSRHHSAAPSGPNIDVIPDGTSNSTLFAEVVHSPNVSGLEPTAKQRLMATGQELRFMSPAQARDFCLSKRNVLPATIVTEGQPGSGWYHHEKRFGRGIYVGASWSIDSPNQSGTVHGLLPPNSINCLSQYDGGTGPRQRKDGLFGLRCASSWHKGGVNLAMADTAVRFVTDDVDPAAYTGLFSIDRGESVVMQPRSKP